MFEFEQTAISIMKTFQGVLKKRNPIWNIYFYLFTPS